ncbi:MAG TPA: hypothetical protein VGD01_17795 [Candidatus Elarobacter sp.]|jgi:hypothetical protein
MPRADPTRSAYCASRHLLRNLDDAAELRRNPMVRACFSAAPGAREGDGGLDRVRGLVHESLARCRERPQAGCAPAGLGRMHAALLRCEIDKQPLAVVAAEMGLSDRQVRRERRAAHEVFQRAFRCSAGSGAVVRDTAALRLMQAGELHELGQSTLATTACEALAAPTQRPERRIEALCLAAEIDLDATRFAAASVRIAEANALLGRRAHELGERGRAVAEQRIDLVSWSLRRATGVAAGVATPPPLAAAQPCAQDADDAERALRVRALAAYALQRWEVGDVPRGADAVRAAQALLPSLDRARTKERLALMLAEARIVSLSGDDEEYALYLALEEIAARRGYLRPLLLARAERIGTELELLGGGSRVLDRILSPFEASARHAMPAELAAAACVAAQVERDPNEALADVDIAERLLPPRGALGMLARAMHVEHAIAARRYEHARLLAQSLRNDAEEIGNGRIRGSAARYLAVVALAQHRRVDAERHAREALAQLEQYGTVASLAHAHEIAERLGIERAPET